MTAAVDVEAAMKRASHLFNQRQYEQAEATLRPIVGAHPTNEKASYLLAMTFYRRGRYTDAEVLFRRIVTANPANADAAQGLGVSLDKLRRVDEAIRALEAALAQKPDFPQASSKLEELRERANRQTLQQDRPAELRQLSTPFNEWRLNPRGTAVGRASDCDIVLSDVGVSKHHAELILVGSQWQVDDRGSTNGTFVNGERVQTHVLRSGDRIQIGSLELEFSDPTHSVVGHQRPPDTSPRQQGEPPRAQGRSDPQGRSDDLTPRAPKNMDEAIKAKDLGPGPLIVQGRRRLRSYPGRFTLAAALVVLAAVIASTPVAELRTRFQLSALDRQDRFNLAVAALAVAAALVLYGVLSSALNTYRIHARRVEFTHGVLVRRTDVVWLYEVKDITFSQPLPLLLVGTGRISLTTERKALLIPGKSKPMQITGLESGHEMRALTEKLREAILDQRRSLKGVWI
jgi:hypothetical protein